MVGRYSVEMRGNHLTIIDRQLGRSSGNLWDGVPLVRIHPTQGPLADHICRLLEENPIETAM